MNQKEEKKTKKRSVHFLAGGISGLITSAAGQPFDVLRTKMIGVNTHNESAFELVKQVIKKEGIRGMYRGIVPTMLRVFPGASIYYGSINALKGAMTTEEGKPPGPLMNFCIGSFSRSIAATVTNPLFIVKSRFEYEAVHGSSTLRRSTVTGTIKHIYAENGLRGMMRGLSPTLARDVPYAGFFYLIYKWIQPKFENDQIRIDEKSTRYQMTVVFPAAAIASCTSTFITHPADVIRTRWHLNSSIDRKGGIKGYFRGVTPRLVKRTLASATSWVLYEKLSHYLETFVN
mmetsp:Transcript_3580/g.5266  ORF Transcript_3580/g.5266 Transcript_3580/m.5266 type:complete len:288 (+) Transcript_3580:118-981(+)